MKKILKKKCWQMTTTYHNVRLVMTKAHMALPTRWPKTIQPICVWVRAKCEIFYVSHWVHMQAVFSNNSLILFYSALQNNKNKASWNIGTIINYHYYAPQKNGVHYVSYIVWGTSGLIVILYNNWRGLNDVKRKIATEVLIVALIGLFKWCFYERQNKFRKISLMA